MAGLYSMVGNNDVDEGREGGREEGREGGGKGRGRGRGRVKAIVCKKNVVPLASYSREDLEQGNRGQDAYLKPQGPPHNRGNCLSLCDNGYRVYCFSVANY